jgi:hypothetical protein
MVEKCFRDACPGSVLFQAYIMADVCTNGVLNVGAQRPHALDLAGLHGAALPHEAE